MMSFRKVLILTLSLIANVNAIAADSGWKFGVGTGIFALNVDGDLGLNTSVGPSLSKLDLSTSDLQEVMDSAFGIAGFMAKDKWKINYTISQLTLAGDQNAEVSNGGFSYKADMEFEISGLDLNVEYKLNPSWSTYLGVRHTTHDIEFNYSGDNQVIDTDIENDWTDLYVGLSYSKAFSKTMLWHTSVDIGAGDSEGSTTFNTGVTWLFSPSWATTLYAKHYSVEYENGSAGDEDWYLYDASEFGAGLGITYLW